MKQPTQQQRAAMWLYHDKYARSGLGADKFYEQLGAYEKRTVDRMIVDICGKQLDEKQTRRINRKRA